MRIGGTVGGWFGGSALAIGHRFGVGTVNQAPAAEPIGVDPGLGSNVLVPGSEAVGQYAPGIGKTPPSALSG
jgi:hypothetical protein